MTKKEISKPKKGKVAIVGRPNVGKSTFLNAILRHKVAIVSPKPQTTRSQISAFYEDDRGQIFFLDTPGFYAGKKGATQYNSVISETIKEADVIVYIVDKTRKWGEEDTQVWNKVIASGKPTILAINKSDIPTPDNTETYRIQCEDDVAKILEISSIHDLHIEGMRQAIFELLPEGERDQTVDLFVTPLLSMSSKEYIAELVREKIYLHTGQEIPYQTRVEIQSIFENPKETKLSIKGKIYVNHARYKPMLIGANGQKIRQISDKTEKELQFMTNKQVSVRLDVEVGK
jgi:GTP-binding protein Era